MKEFPMLFRAEMVRALLEGRKTQTRRLPNANNSLVDGRMPSKALLEGLDFSSQKIFVDSGPSPAGNAGPYLHVPRKDGDTVHRVYPTLQAGDRIWVKETWANAAKQDSTKAPEVLKAIRESGSARWALKADYDGYLGPLKWTPSILMPRWASRITLEVLSVNPQRLQEITEDDARDEGCSPTERAEGRYFTGSLHKIKGTPKVFPCARAAYKDIWASINGVDSWEKNPFVWAITFRRVDA